MEIEVDHVDEVATDQLILVFQKWQPLFDISDFPLLFRPLWRTKVEWFTLLRSAKRFHAHLTIPFADHFRNWSYFLLVSHRFRNHPCLAYVTL